MNLDEMKRQLLEREDAKARMFGAKILYHCPCSGKKLAYEQPDGRFECYECGTIFDLKREGR